jgi:hypothetical protein
MPDTRLYFQCPKTKNWFSTTFDIPKNKPVGGQFNLYCRHCGEMHQFRGSEARRSRPVSEPNAHVVARKARPRGIRIRSSRPLFTPKLKDPCWGRNLRNPDPKALENHELASTLWMLEGKLRCDDCGQFVGAKKRSEGGGFETDPRPHERYKEPRRPARKRGPRK